MRGLIVGLGSIGRRHLANLRTLDPSGFIAVCHRRSPRVETERSDRADVDVWSLEEALATRPEFAIVATPASLHVATALRLAQHGIHLLVEKPLSDRLDGVDRLIETCRLRGVVLLVGYTLRFHRPLAVMRQAIAEGRIGRVLSIRAEVGQYLPDWRPGSDYRRSPTALRELGGGALLELSHEIDYVRWLAGEIRDVTARVACVGDLEIDVEDCAEIILTFTSGALGNVHLDLLQRAPARTCRVIGSEGTLAWDAGANRVACYQSASGLWADLCPAAPVDRNIMYLEELRHFLDCVRGADTPSVSGVDARRVLEVALAARDSAARQETVAV